MQSKNNKTVVVAMSGGVDSSVAAFLLKQAGYNVIGLHMVDANAEQEEIDGMMAKSICEKLGIEFVVENYSSQMQQVKDYFINEYASGRTPNPCVVCNREVKFKPFIDFMKKIGADYFATGHYAKIEHINGEHLLRKAKDASKDQTYFLNQLSQEQLKHALFPLGELTKPEVRKIAEENGLATAHKKDSFDVCFMGSAKFKDFMRKNYPEKQGNIVDIKTKKIVGKHDGVSKFTLGQRKGLGIGGKSDGNGESWYVVDKNMKKGILYVSQGEGEELLSRGLVTDGFNFMPRFGESGKVNCYAKTRYRQDDQECVAERVDGGVKVTFKIPQRAVTPGQYVVLYDNEGYMLGGGTIKDIIRR